MEILPGELELAPAPPPGALEADALGELVLHDPDALAAQLDTYSKSRELLVAWLFAHLVAGVDFMLIHRRVRGQPCSKRADAASARCGECGGKATLCKPGSEKLCGLLRLRPRFSRDVATWEMLGSLPGVLAYVCELVTASGSVVAEGRGARDKALDGDDVNKTVKMAQKSAQTDAVLRCAGLSEIFTQDLEDMPAVNAEADEPGFTPPGRASAAPREPDLVEPLRRSVADHGGDVAAPTSGEGGRPDDALSRARYNRLLALVHEAVRSHDVPDSEHEAVFDRARAHLGAWVATTGGRPRLEWCSFRVYDELCAQVGPAVAAAVVGPAPRPRPAMRLVWRDKVTGRVLN